MDIKRPMLYYTLLAVVGFVFFVTTLALLFKNENVKPEDNNEDLITRLDSLEAKLESLNSTKISKATFQEEMSSLSQILSDELEIIGQMQHNFSSNTENQLNNTKVLLEKLDIRMTEYESSAVKHVIACEHSKAVMECQGIHKTIKIKYANYGRTQPGSVVCPDSNIQSITCFSVDSTQKVAQSCDGHNKCELMAINSVFGDPCSTTYKYLKVEYYCL